MSKYTKLNAGVFDLNKPRLPFSRGRHLGRSRYQKAWILKVLTLFQLSQAVRLPKRVLSEKQLAAVNGKK